MMPAASLVAVLACASVARAAHGPQPFSLMPLFSDNMVVQASSGSTGRSDGPAVWGWAPPNARIALSRCTDQVGHGTKMHGADAPQCAPGASGAVTAYGTADAAGRWSVLLPASPASPTTFTVTAICVAGCTSRAGEGTPRATATNVIYGDVILCSGQVRAHSSSFCAAQLARNAIMYRRTGECAQRWCCRHSSFSGFRLPTFAAPLAERD